MRKVMTRVLPDPAPARMRTGPSVVSTAARCSGFSLSKRCRKMSRPEGKCPVSSVPLPRNRYWTCNVKRQIRYTDHQTDYTARRTDYSLRGISYIGRRKRISWVDILRTAHNLELRLFAVIGRDERGPELRLRKKDRNQCTIVRSNRLEWPPNSSGSQ